MLWEGASVACMEVHFEIGIVSGEDVVPRTAFPDRLPKIGDGRSSSYFILRNVMNGLYLWRKRTFRQHKRPPRISHGLARLSRALALFCHVLGRSHC
jgi:hypothetical protein